ncbi:bacterio-opsin activator domain-containing protein [Salinilacihabitans rarus]|uniref:bacterio-opsin activator domain-containing protein n=1 Tax=Salinilacihabitans rarus TaxID=2961596 RepID=UPI0020C88385|nr:bacterio-opsin activator domain-containing protein [Salinilacihabitans rarus]
MSAETGRGERLTEAGYEALLDAAETYREALVVRLCAEVGLRPAELSRLTPGAVDRVRTDPPRYLLCVPAADGDEIDRAAYLPARLERELRRYARSNGVGDDERLFPVTPRRLQMLVAEVADRADDPSLSSTSTSDLRRFFARRALAADVNPRAVKAAGGWRSFEALEAYLPEPTDEEVVDAFAAADPETGAGAEASADVPSGGVADAGVVRSLLSATDRCALVRLDEDGYVDRWNRSAATTFGYRAGEVVGTHVSALFTDEDVDRGVPERLLEAALDGRGVEEDGWLVRKDGSRFRATEVVTPLRGEAGRHRGFALFVCDVTAFHDRLESLREEHAALERAHEVARRSRAVATALFEASTHEEVETETCVALADGDAYAFAWIDRTTLSGGARSWRATAGVSPAEVERLADALDDSGDDGVAVREEVEGVAFDGAVASVPLGYGDTVYGTLHVGADRPDAFADDEREWLETLGRQVGYAVAAVRRRNLLLSDTLVELEFACRDGRSFFVDASARLDCRFELDSLVPVSETTQLYYVHLEEAPPAEVFDLAAEDPGIDDCRLIETYEDGWRVEFVVEGSSPTLTLTEYGATVVEMTVADGEATIAVECAADADLRTLVGGLRSAFPDSELLGKREVERSVQTAREFREGLEDRLTDRQEAALRAAYFGGYYDWPRESTAEEIADAMGITSPTLHSHLRKGQRELLRTFFDAPPAEDRQ